MTGALGGPSRREDVAAELEEDFRVLGLDPSTLPATQPEPEDEGIWPQHEEAVRAFLAVCRQWRVAGGGMGRPQFLGLDYAGVRAGFDLAGITVSPEVWTQVRLIEAGAVSALNEGSS